MAPTRTSWRFRTTHLFKTKREVTITGFYGGGSPTHPYDPFTVPAGLHCKQVTHGGGRVGFYLDEFPRSIFPSGGMLTHDAVHYGVTIPSDAVEDVTHPPLDLPSKHTVTCETMREAMDLARKTAEVPFTCERRGWFWIWFNLRMDGTYIVSRSHEESLPGSPREVLYDGPSTLDAEAAWKNA